MVCYYSLLKMRRTKLKNILLQKKKNHTMSKVKEIIESINVGTWEWNIETGERIYSERWAQITGYNLKEFGTITKKKLESIIHPDDFEISGKLIRQHLAGELPYYKYELRVKHKNGTWVWITERGSVIKRNKGGKPSIMFGTHTNITKEKQAEIALENYIHTLNHDLKSPLTSIIGYSSFLVDEELTPEETKKYGAILNKTGKKMLKMIESYLSFAKIEKGQDLLSKKPKPILEFIDEISKNFTELIQGNKMKIILEGENIKKSLSLKNILIEEILIYSVINNLVHNAIDASPKGDAISLSIHEENGNLCLKFFNKGEISKDFQKKLFKKFASTKKNGTGIGLYSARLIARAHSGDVTYTSVPLGTIFTLKIPIATI